MKTEHLSETARLLLALLPPAVLASAGARDFRDVWGQGRPFGAVCVNGVSFQVGPFGIKVRMHVSRESNGVTYRVERVVLRKGERGLRTERVLHEGVEPEHLGVSFEQVLGDKL